MDFIKEIPHGGGKAVILHVAYDIPLKFLIFEQGGCVCSHSMYYTAKNGMEKGRVPGQRGRSEKASQEEMAAVWEEFTERLRDHQNRNPRILNIVVFFCNCLLHF
jgi:hypothetical protein